MIVVDTSGFIKYESNKIMDKDIIVILGKNVYEEYLLHLRNLNISYTFSGKDGKDLQIALKSLKNDFGIENLVLSGGGVLNGSFLSQGLIDEIYLLICPAIDGLAGIQKTFDYLGASEDLPANNQALELLSAEPKEFGAVYLRYKVHKLN